MLSQLKFNFVNCWIVAVAPLSFAQILINGQTFTNGLSIIDAPNPNSQFHAGSVLPIAVEISGNGKLPPAAEIPGSNIPTHYDLLNLFLVSSQTKLNLTVSEGTQFLTNETGTVRHLNWLLPTCVPTGQYNLTFYETSHINDELHFIITPIPITVDGGDKSSICTTGVNSLEDQPQACSPLPGGSPFLPAASPLITITLPPDASLPLPLPSSLTVTSPTTVSLVIVSQTVITKTVPGQPTNTLTTSMTTETLEFKSTQTSDGFGFVPVNGDSPTFPVNFFPILLSIFGTCFWTSFVL